MKKVPCDGPRDAKIAIVGESPGRDEVRSGQPFVGYSGRKMNEWLRKAGIDRDDCFVTNACKYSPTGKKKEFFFKKGKLGDPTTLYIEGMGELVEELADVRPNVVFALGNYALWALTQKWGVTKWRGSILESTIVPGQKIVVGLHPAFILRGMWKLRPLFIWDARRVREESASPEIKLPQRELIAFPTETQIADAIETLCADGLYSVDSEWYDPYTPACIGFASDPSRAICIPAFYTCAMPAYRELLENDCVKVMVNAMFDVPYLQYAGIPIKTWHPEKGSLIHDVQVAHKMCWPDLKKDLGTMVSIYTREPYFKEDLKIWSKTKTNDELLFEYNCKDNATQIEIAGAIEDEMEDCGTKRAYELNMTLFEPLKRSTVKGIRVDYAALMKVIKEIKSETEELQSILNDIVGYSINVRSQKQVAALVYDTLGIRERAKRTTNQMALMDIAAQEADTDTKAILTVIVKIRRNRKLLSAYLRPQLVHDDGRFRGAWDMGGTKNGRYSHKSDSYKKRGAGLQTIPDRARHVFIPDDGYVFVGHDLEQAEARVMAYKSEDWRLIDWIEADQSIHKMLGAHLFDKDPSEIDKYDPDGTTNREYYLAKQSRHATNYGEGPRMLKLQINKYYLDTNIGVTEAWAKRTIAKIHALHPAIEHYWSWVRNELSRNGAITNPMGRRRRFTDTWGDSLFKDAYAFYPQSTISDLNKLIQRAAWEDYQDQVWLHADMHDGGLWMVPEELTDEFVERLPEYNFPLQIDAHEFIVPMEVKKGMTWADV